MKKELRRKLIIFFVSSFLICCIFFVQLIRKKENDSKNSQTTADHEELIGILLRLEDHSSHQFLLADQSFAYEVVNSAESRVQGLSGQNEIGSDGMLFAFRQKDKHGIWMKEMKFDIDLIWMMDGKVVEITLRATKPKEDENLSNLFIYKPSELVNMVVEVEAGFVEQNQIKIGQQMKLL